MKRELLHVWICTRSSSLFNCPFGIYRILFFCLDGTQSFDRKINYWKLS